MINDCCVCPEVATFFCSRSYSSWFIRNLTWYSLFRTLYYTPFVVFVFWGAGAGTSIFSIVSSQPLADGWNEMKRLPADVSEFHTRTSAAPVCREWNSLLGFQGATPSGKFRNSPSAASGANVGTTFAKLAYHPPHITQRLWRDGTALMESLRWRISISRWHTRNNLS